MLYTREIYTFMMFLSDMGGLVNSMLVIGKIIMYPITENLLYAAIINELF